MRKWTGNCEQAVEVVLVPNTCQLSTRLQTSLVTYMECNSLQMGYPLHGSIRMDGQPIKPFTARSQMKNACTGTLTDSLFVLTSNSTLYEVPMRMNKPTNFAWMRIALLRISICISYTYVMHKIRCGWYRWRDCSGTSASVSSSGKMKHSSRASLVLLLQQLPSAGSRIRHLSEHWCKRLVVVSNHTSDV